MIEKERRRWKTGIEKRYRNIDLEHKLKMCQCLSVIYQLSEKHYGKGHHIPGNECINLVQFLKFNSYK